MMNEKFSENAQKVIFKFKNIIDNLKSGKSKYYISNNRCASWKTGCKDTLDPRPPFHGSSIF